MKRIFFLFILIFNISTITYATTDLKGVWVASVYNLDYPSTGTVDETVLKKEAITILNNVEKMGVNAIFLQVRPSADAFYDSDIFPWSKYLTGSNGVSPNNHADHDRPDQRDHQVRGGGPDKAGHTDQG